MTRVLDKSDRVKRQKSVDKKSARTAPEDYKRVKEKPQGRWENEKCVGWDG